MSLIWHRTFVGSRCDFTAEDDGQHVGRIYRFDGGPQDGAWFWACTGCQRGVEATGVRPLSGTVDSKNDAIQALFEAWKRAKAWSEESGLPLMP